MVITNISDPQTNLAIIVFLGGLLANILYTVLSWWNSKGKYEQEKITITFNFKVLMTAAGSLIPIVIVTFAGFSTLLNTVNASNPVSYAAAFFTAFVATLGANGFANSTLLKNLNAEAAAQLEEKKFQDKLALKRFMDQIEEENRKLQNAKAAE